jgi:ribosome maturation factor RimP
MHTRQLRLTSSAQIREHLSELIGKKINIVLNNNTVLFGELILVQGNALHVLNMRLKKMEILISQINEIHLDFKA